MSKIKGISMLNTNRFTKYYSSIYIFVINNDRWIDVQIDRVIARWTDLQMDRFIDGQIYRWIDLQIDRYVDGQINRYMYRYKDGQIY